MEKLDEYIDKFINHQKARNYSQGTIQSYFYTLKFYKCYLQKAQIEEKDFFILSSVISFINYLDEYKQENGKPLSEWTKLGIISSLKTYFNYLFENDYILIDPFDKIDKIKLPHKLPKNIPTEQEVIAIIESIDTTTVKGYRTRTIIELLYSTGIRRIELTNLTIYDVDLNNGFIRVQKTKFSRFRILPVGKIACQFLEEYINTIRPQLLKNNIHEHTLFLNQYGKKYSLTGISTLVRVTVRKILKSAKYSCHSFRHACATEMLKGNANIKYVQDMLGHKELSSTQIYTQVLPLDLLQVHKTTHPSWTLFDE